MKKKIIFLVLMFIMGLLAGYVKAADLTLAWDPAPGATGYKLYYGTTSKVYTTTIDVKNVTQYTIKDLPGLSAPLNGRLAVGIATVPAGTVIGWDQVAGATGYKIKYGTTAGNFTTTIDAKNVLQYLLTGLQNDTTYYVAISAYRVEGPTYYFAATAYDPSMESGYSNELTWKSLESPNSSVFSFKTFPALILK